jgi:hypothetical protein
MELEIGWRLMVATMWISFCVTFVIFAVAVQKYKKRD